MVSLENKPMYLWDFYFQFSELYDFLEFSDRNIEWQCKTNIQILKRNARIKKYDSDEFQAELNNIEGRFYISLSRSIRYSAIIGLATSIEWISKFINDNAIEKITKFPKGLNESTHIIKTFLDRCKLEQPNNLDTLDKIIKIRNCIAHAMGSVKYYKFGHEIREVISTMDGFSLSDNHFIEEVINIDKGTIQSIISETQEWIIDLIDECKKKNLIAIE